jgi:molecular chaperone GrpE (heat shock protein)
MSALDPQRRRQLLEAVEHWLDSASEAEPPPTGIPADMATVFAPAPDLFSFLSQLTALTRETQLQGRATNRLHTELGGKLETMSEQIARLDASLRKMSEVRREARLEVVGELLDVRDRFVRGLEEAHRRLAALPAWFARFTQRPVLEAVIQGNLLARERLDEVLRRLDVQEIPCLGKPFDPTLMHATEVAQTTTAPPGTVLEVFRAGYTAGGRVFRFADVKVAADPSMSGLQKER